MATSDGACDEEEMMEEMEESEEEENLQEPEEAGHTQDLPLMTPSRLAATLRGAVCGVGGA